jgi:hypothetical protein
MLKITQEAQGYSHQRLKEIRAGRKLIIDIENSNKLI